MSIPPADEEISFSAVAAAVCFGDDYGAVGGVEAAARPEGDELVLVGEECRVSFKLVGDYLVAKDNSGCGGVNVRLDGAFRKGRRITSASRSCFVTSGTPKSLNTCIGRREELIFL